MTETRWLSDHEQRVWRALLEVNQQIFAEIDTCLRKDSGLHHTYYEILVRLSEAPGRRLRMSELADRSSSSRSRLSHAIARLEDRGWVVRSECDEDGRGAFAELTDEGFAALDEAAPKHVETVRRLVFDPLEPEQVTELGRICDELLRNLESGRSRTGDSLG